MRYGCILEPVPKIVDRESARREIAGALLTVLAERGIDAVSVRTVATAAGRSPGAVQKYFATKDEMLAAALDLYAERSAARIAAVPRGEDLATTVITLISATLPLDEQRRLETLVLHEFALRAAHDDHLAERLRELDRQVLTELTEGLELGAANASALLALADGLAMRLLYRSHTPAEVTAALRAGVTALLGT